MMHEMITCQSLHKGRLTYIQDCLTKDNISYYGFTPSDGHISYATTAANAKRIASAAVETEVEMDFITLL